jgi:hypothetical protein
MIVGSRKTAARRRIDAESATDGMKINGSLFLVQPVSANLA